MKGRKEGRMEGKEGDKTPRICLPTTRPHLVLELFFSAVGVVLQLVQLLLADAHHLAPLLPAE